MMEELLQKPCWVIDFLPEQVPADAAGQFFAVEKLYLQKNRQGDLRARFAEIILKVNCYYDIQVCTPEVEDWVRNPAPARLYSRIRANTEPLCILLPQENALFTLDRQDTCMAVYNPSESLLRLLERLATAAGLFLWQPPQSTQDEGQKSC